MPPACLWWCLHPGIGLRARIHQPCFRILPIAGNDLESHRKKQVGGQPLARQSTNIALPCVKRIQNISKYIKILCSQVSVECNILHTWHFITMSGHNFLYFFKLFPHTAPAYLEKQGCRLSRRPHKGQRVISLCFFEICFSLWFRSDSLSVSPEPGLQIHCVFQGFLFLFSKNVLFFSM